jgi:hypothetical protein
VAEHVVAEVDIRELGGEPGQGRPTLEETLPLVGIEAVEVVGDPDRVEVGERRREDVFLLVLDDRDEITPCMSCNGRQPTEFRNHEVDRTHMPRCCRVHESDRDARAAD